MNYLLIKRAIYWMPDRCGYTGLKREAGRYSEEEARALAHDGEVSEFSPSMEQLGVYMIEESKAPRFAPGCWPDVRQRETERDICALLEALKIALEVMEVVDGDNDCTRGIEAVEAAIAKAEGRS